MGFEERSQGERRWFSRPLPPRDAWRALVAVVAVAGLVAAAFLLPIPGRFMYLPGPVRDVERLVRVGGAPTYSSEGKLYMTTVSVDVSVTLAEVFEAAVDPHKQVVPEQAVTGGQPLERLEERQRREMTSSKQRAAEVALSALGLGEAEGDGVRVVKTRRGTPADGVLRRGDVIVSVDGRRVSTTCQVVAAISRVEVGDEVSVGVRRDEGSEPMMLTLETAPSPLDKTSSYIGVEMRDVDYRFDSEVSVDFTTGRIAGPSAGLMFTLALYDRLTPEDLTGGRTIAGTGVIDCGGRVLSIGGVTQKVAAAESNGADLFLSPVANATEARAAAGEIDVVAVSTFSEAVERLEAAH